MIRATITMKIKTKRFLQGIINFIWFVFNSHKVYDKERRNSPKHKRKVAIVKTLWIWVGSTLLIANAFIPPMVFAPIVVVSLLTMTFLSFMILDETE